MVGFRVERGSLVGGGCCVAYTDRVLDEPFVDGFCWMCHEDSAFEVGFGKDIRKGGCMVEMETGLNTISHRS